MLRNGSLSLDLRTRQAHVGDRVIDLSAREFALAEMFLRHPGQVLSREQLLSHVWGYDYDPMSNVVEVYVRYLRNKIGADRIATVRGAGYRLVHERAGTAANHGRERPGPLRAAPGVLRRDGYQSRVSSPPSFGLSLPGSRRWSGLRSLERSNPRLACSTLAI